MSRSPRREWSDFVAPLIMILGLAVMLYGLSGCSGPDEVDTRPLVWTPIQEEPEIAPVDPQLLTFIEEPWPDPTAVLIPPVPPGVTSADLELITRALERVEISISRLTERVDGQPPPVDVAVPEPLAPTTQDAQLLMAVTYAGAVIGIVFIGILIVLLNVLRVLRIHQATIDNVYGRLTWVYNNAAVETESST